MDSDRPVAADRLPDPGDEIHADPPHEVWKAARERESRCACDPCWFAFIARQPDPNHAATGWSNVPPVSAAVPPAEPPEEPYVISDERLAEIRAMVSEDGLVPGIDVIRLSGAVYDLLVEREARGR